MRPSLQRLAESIARALVTVLLRTSGTAHRATPAVWVEALLESGIDVWVCPVAARSSGAGAWNVTPFPPPPEPPQDPRRQHPHDREQNDGRANPGTWHRHSPLWLDVATRVTIVTPIAG